MRNMSQSSDWAMLPKGALLNITQRLTKLGDYVSFGAVCRPWRTFFLRDKNRLCSSRPPLALFASGRTKASSTTKLHLYSTSTRKMYQKIQFNLPGDKLICGSSFGWLITMERVDEVLYQPQLQNPFLSDDCIIDDLPPFVGTDEYYLQKAVLSCHPLSPGGFIVAGVTSLGRRLVFCRPGDTKWTFLGSWKKKSGCAETETGFIDLIFSQKKQQFCALRQDGQVVAVHFEVSEGIWKPKSMQLNMPPFTIQENCKNYLVEDLSGELMLIAKSSSTTIQVYKLDLVEGKQIEIRDIGRTILFVDDYGAAARSLSDCPRHQQNVIYFTWNVNEPSMGMYWLDCKRSGVLCDVNYPIAPPPQPEGLPEPIWIEPTLLPTS